MSIIFSDATIAVGGCSALINLCSFQRSGGVTYEGLLPWQASSIGLDVEESTFSGTASIVATNGVVTLTRLTFLGDTTSLSSAMVFRGSVHLIASEVHASSWRFMVVDWQAQGVVQWQGGSLVGGLNQNAMVFRGIDASVSISGVTFEFNEGGGVSVDGVSLVIENSAFASGAGVPCLSLGNGTARVVNCTFASHQSAPVIRCGVENGGKADVDVSER